jgi:phage/plasmid-associated DNA primase
MTTNITFHVEPQQNILNGITLYEPVEKSVLMKLINSTLLRKEFNNTFAGIMYENEKQQLQRYASLMVDTRIPITYERPENNPYGRCNPPHALGLYPIRREIRHTLAKGLFVDIDVKNCHPVMLMQICIREGEPCEALTDYVNNRQKYFDAITTAYGCNEEAAKNAFIMYAYGGGFKKWFEKNKIIIENCSPTVIQNGDEVCEIECMETFRKSMRNIHKRVLEANPHLADVVRKLKHAAGKKEGEYNLAGSVCSFVLQEYEVRVLEQIFLYCNSKGLILDGNCVLCADGIMIEPRFYKPELLNTLADVIQSTVGFKLTFTQKEMTQDYLKILDKSLDFDLSKDGLSDGALAEHFAVVYANKFMAKDGEVFQFNGVYWERLDKKNSALHNFVDNTYRKYLVSHFINKTQQINEEINNTTEDAKKDQLEKQRKILMENATNATLLARTVKKRNFLVADIINKITIKNIEFDADPFLFAFTNKVYSLRENRFVEPSYKQYITTSCGYDFCPYYQNERTVELQALIETILPSKQVRDYYLTCLATGLYGEQVEVAVIATGVGGNGKSLINSLFMAATGEYGYKMGSSVITTDIKEGANPAIANLHKRRFVLIQEPNNSRRICASTLKEITGDKTINARKNYSNECKTSLNLTLFLECNELPLLDEVGNAVERRIRAIEFSSRFISRDKYDELTDTAGFGIANPYFKTTEFQTASRQALFTILLPYWQAFQQNNYELPALPTECKKITTDYLANSDDIYEWFSEKFERGDIAEDILYLDEIYNTYTYSAVWQNMSKADRRKNNKKHFTSKIEKNLFLRQFYRPRDAYFGGNKINRPFVVGYKKPVSTDIDGADEDTLTTTTETL